MAACSIGVYSAVVRVRVQTAAALRALAAEEPIPLIVAGDCMSPLLRTGERIRVQGARLYLPGDIIAFRHRGGQLLVHRVLGYFFGRRGVGIVAKGDNLSCADQPAGLESILGRVVDCDGRTVTIPSRRRWRAAVDFARTLVRRTVRPWASAISS